MASLLQFVLDWQLHKTELKIEDFENFAVEKIEMNILILSLQEGLMPAEALLTPPFQHELKKKSILEELNAFLKQEKCDRNMKKNVPPSKALEAVETNARLVIGGEGAWNVHFTEEVMQAFAANNGHGYNIVSFADLLRIIRNIFQHGHEEPKAMLSIFRTTNPSPTQMMIQFFQLLPFFYLHALSCFEKFLGPRQDSVPELYVKIYDLVETVICVRGMANMSLKPLKKSAAFTIQFESPTDDTHVEVVDVKDDMDGKIMSCIDVFVDVVPKLILKSAKLWSEIPVESLIVRSCGKTIDINKTTIAISTGSAVMVSSIRPCF